MDPFIGEIRIFGGTFAPVGYLLCDGSHVSISQYDALFSLIGTTYGGDGVETFALPDLRGRTPVHMGQSPFGSYSIGEQAGAESVTLKANQLPAHGHNLVATTLKANTKTPGNTVVPAATTGNLLYSNEYTETVPMNLNSIGPAGKSQPIPVMMPYIVMNFIIAYDGIFPSRG